MTEVKPPWITTVGRRAGFMGIFLGACLLLTFALFIMSFGKIWWALLGTALPMTLFGSVLAVFGNPATKQHYETVEHSPSERLCRLHREIPKYHFPFVICTVHYQISATEEGFSEDPLHKNCNPKLDHIVVADEEDLKLVLASLH